MIAVRLQSSGWEGLLAQAREIGQEGNVALVGAFAVADLVRRHLFSLDEERANTMRGARTHFYANAAKSVHWPVTNGVGAGFVITWIGLAQRWLGGHIEAGGGTSSASGGPTKYLAIPARAESYGKTPGEFDDLEFVPRKAGGGMLVQTLQTQFVYGKKTKSGTRDYSTTTVGGLVMFWLVTSVDQAPDPDVMPTEEDMGEAARFHMEKFLSRRLGSGPQNPDPKP